jgi:hemerythrin
MDVEGTKKIRSGMKPIQWTEKFSVGFSEMDRQHKRLIAMINRLMNEPEAQTHSETISDLLTHMITYAREHFQDEETLMSKHGYPFKDHQEEQHRAFVKKTVDLCSAVEVGVDIVPLVMLDYLKEWLVHHILEQDMRYKTFFLERGVC